MEKGKKKLIKNHEKEGKKKRKNKGGKEMIY